MIKKPMTISFQKYDSTSKEIKTGKVRTSKKNGIQSNMLQFTTDLQRPNYKGILKIGLVSPTFQNKFSYCIFQN